MNDSRVFEQIKHGFQPNFSREAGKTKKASQKLPALRADLNPHPLPMLEWLSISHALSSHYPEPQSPSFPDFLNQDRVD